MLDGDVAAAGFACEGGGVLAAVAGGLVLVDHEVVPAGVPVDFLHL